MVEQCSLLRSDAAEVSPKPFQLIAASCEWSKLQTAVKKKEHPWKELPGGGAAALARVRKRPDTFINVLNPTGSDSWTFEHVVSKYPSCTVTTLCTSLRIKVLLPSVLTSEKVSGALKDIYQITQHVSRTAGHELYVILAC